MHVKSKKTRGTPYDDVFRTMLVKSGKLRIPFVNEMFRLHDPFPTNTPITNLSNEYFIDEGQSRQKKIITDSALCINGRTFHIECQSSDDGSILVRMFEYDTQIALFKHIYSDYHLTVRIPESGVLFLRTTTKTPKEMQVTIETAGTTAEYSVEVLRMSDYTIDDLIRKDLLFLFPFYMFNLEKEFNRYEQGDNDSKSKVLTNFEKLLNYINMVYEQEELTYDLYLLLTDMLKKVTEHLTQNYTIVRKELDNIMGGRVLEYKGERIFKKGEAKGRTEGRAEGAMENLVSLVYDGLLDEKVAIDRAREKYGVSAADFKKMLEEFDPNTDLKQG